MWVICRILHTSLNQIRFELSDLMIKWKAQYQDAHLYTETQLPQKVPPFATSLFGNELTYAKAVHSRYIPKRIYLYRERQDNNIGANVVS